ncbi:VOC family protein [Peribacillus simplex]|uniref:VOC family protein n=1 Tax=Peribacillus simplex TaxID=1478 RepID=UPI0034E8549D
MGVQAEKIFVNLPVKDLDASVEFFTKVGFEFNEQMTNENATCMVISESIYVMLLVEDYFKTFTKKEIPNSAASTEAIVALSVKSKEEVDEIVNRALDAGGKPFKADLIKIKLNARHSPFRRTVSFFESPCRIRVSRIL